MQLLNKIKGYVLKNRQGLEGTLLVKHIDLILRVIMQSKHLQGSDLDLMVETIRELNKRKSYLVSQMPSNPNS